MSCGPKFLVFKMGSNVFQLYGDREGGVLDVFDQIFSFNIYDSAYHYLLTAFY